MNPSPIHSTPSAGRDALLASVRRTYAASLDIIERKNHDYGATDDPYANFRAAELLGVSVEKGILIRTLDKIRRIDNLLEKDPHVTDESMGDSIDDAIGYLAILKAFRESKRAITP